MQSTFSKITLAVLLTTGTFLASGITNTAAAKPTAKHVAKTSHAKKLFGFSSGVGCDGSGGAGMQYKFMGWVYYRSNTVPGSALCN
jgi:hypothetical protein